MPSRTLNVTVTRDYVNYSTTLETTSCGSCGIPFAMPQDLLRKCRDDSDEWFWCPNGHKLHYAESEADRLRRQNRQLRENRDAARSALTHERDQRQAAQRSAAAYKGQATRLRTRARAGVCPECHRQFPSLQAHMADKHPDFSPEALPS